jgi:uncharacterized membrane protein YfcA
VEVILVVGGAVAGGFVNGLTGFGTGMTALVFWLHVMPPAQAAPMVVICSVLAQLQSLPAIWPAVDARRLAPFAVGGLIGIPVGTWLLAHVSPAPFKTWVGVVVAAYCATVLAGRLELTLRRGGRAADGLVGFGGGVLGGLAGLSGPLPVIWAGLRSWSKDQRRGVIQGFNLIVLGVALVAHGAAGLLTPSLGWLAVLAVPGTVVGAFLGQRLYRRLDDRSFDRAVLAILLVAGVLLIWSGLAFAD